MNLTFHNGISWIQKRGMQKRDLERQAALLHWEARCIGISTRAGRMKLKLAELRYRMAEIA